LVADRRESIRCVARSVLAAPFAATIRPAAADRILGNYDGPPWDGFRRGMRELGYIEERTIAIDWRFADGHTERYPVLASAFAEAKVDLIVTSGTPAALAAKQATSSIPILRAISAYPERLGLAESLSHPGGNITGLSHAAPR
jgi:putative tryptophan/tyrosine transport system substrate-binding protein